MAGEADPPPAAYERVRARFPYFEAQRRGEQPAFMENAGGSQVPACVADAVRDHLLSDCAQLGAGHAVSGRSDAVVKAAHAAVAEMLGCAPPAGADSHAGGGGAAGGGGHVAIGPSTSQLFANLGACFSRLLGPEDEVVVQEACHEANIGPWVRCAADSGATLRFWPVDTRPRFSRPSPAASGADTDAAAAAAAASAGAPLGVSFPCASSLSQLASALSPRTRVVAVTHVSNILGGVQDLPRLVNLIRSEAPRARLVVDGVAFAPHRAPDVAAWGVDFYAFSIYKTWGPHAAALYGSAPAFAELAAACGPAGGGAAAGGAAGGVACSFGPNHYFVPGSDPSYWFELGGASHEACAGVVALADYLRALGSCLAPAGGEGAAAAAAADGGGGEAAPERGAAAGGPATARALRRPPLARSEVLAAFEAAAALEAPLGGPILELLASHPRVILVGPGPLEDGGDGGGGGADGGGGRGGRRADHGWCERVPTISFVSTVKPSRQVAREIQERGYAIRSGHAYAHRLLTALAPALLPYLQREAAEGDGDGDGQGALEATVEDGVVRVSLLHYNTPSEVEGLVRALREVL
ncbi:cysteine desulfurase [Raphidocelis subcapitata]|uniref:Cysteine desulfurase n=1 Tax=Raphidocelis subcapitata TaxID=307507 RepID=A0A2V0PE85_9CHLO|nr:cysteine desulfurase [Raphidocelis subcapitata]|eukprot:GBF97282.1 cysteine desulfurase [Raphidocelis subcapitata]